jgi:hypothetical protein
VANLELRFLVELATQTKSRSKDSMDGLKVLAMFVTIFYHEYVRTFFYLEEEETFYLYKEEGCYFEPTSHHDMLSFTE